MIQKGLVLLSLLITISYSHYTIAQDIENPKIKWQFKTQGTVRGAAVTLKNRIYFGSSDGFIYALDKNNGALIWKYETNGAIVSKPLIHNNILYISSRDQNIYAINIDNGNLNWSFEMNEILSDYHGGWKYYMASPSVIGKNILIGSGDGNLYSIVASNGKLNWKYKTNGRIRAKALVHDNKIYQPSNDGYVYILNSEGKLDWKFETKGAKYNPSDYPFDRSSIIAQPLIKDNILIIASRDGNTYGIDLKTHKKIWNFTYGNTWAMSSEISDDLVFVGWSTNDIFCALDLKTGKEKWKIKTGSHNYTSALASKSSIYIGSADGKMYRLNKFTGEKIWDYTIGDEIYSSPIYDADTKNIFFGCDNGFFYALNETSEVHKAVFHPYNKKGKLKGPWANKDIIPYLTKKAFKHIDNESDLYQFIENRIIDKAPSVIVFPYLVIPHNVLGTNPEKGLMREYLETGGKIIWPGDIPSFYERDNLGKQIRDKTPASKLLGVEFDSSESGIYFSKTTPEGLNWGIPKWTKAYSANVIPSKDIIPLAYNEFNDISIWMKKFHPRQGSGYISIRTWGANIQIKEEDLQLLYNIAVYGLE